MFRLVLNMGVSLVLLFVVSVNAVALQGPKYTRYVPCGLGIIYFEKVANSAWRGVINFRLYPNINNANIEIGFDNPMQISWASQNTTIYARNNWTNFLFKPSGKLPPLYYFHLSKKNNPNSTDLPVVTKVKLNNFTLCNATVKESETIESLNVTQEDDSNYRQVCGRRALRNAELTSVRTEAKAGDWPWHVAVLIGDLQSNFARYHCGGNIISRTAVLTAGHCAHFNSVRLQPHHIIIEAGIDDLRNEDQPGRQVLPAVDIILHPAYNGDQSTADLAIIRVNRFTYTAYVQPICIWGPSYDKASLFGQVGVVAGFGTTERNALSDRLRSTYTMVQNDTTCIAYSPQLYINLLNEFSFCAGLSPQAGTNPLKGDSGGGLVVATMQPDHRVSWFIRGVLSKCGVPDGQINCDPKYYVIYTDVAPHYGWIYHNGGLNFVSNIVE